MLYFLHLTRHHLRQQQHSAVQNGKIPANCEFRPQIFQDSADKSQRRKAFQALVSAGKLLCVNFEPMPIADPKQGSDGTQFLWTPVGVVDKPVPIPAGFIIAGMIGRLPLPTLLSHALVAFIIEFDNEFEHQTPHRTTAHGPTPNARDAPWPVPWLVSMVMWSNFMQFVGEDGITVRELQRKLKCTGKDMENWLTRMGAWWGYIVVESQPAASLPGSGPPAKRSRAAQDALVRPTTGGRRAVAVWRPLAATIENRWRARFGEGAIELLRQSLAAITVHLDGELPDSLPILGHGLFSRWPQKSDERPHEKPQVAPQSPQPPSIEALSGLPLSSLLSKVLLAFALEFERDSEISLAICANVLRLAGKEGVPVRDLPAQAGVSREAVAMSLSFLEKRGCEVVERASPDDRLPGSRSGATKLLRLTPKGLDERDAYRMQIEAIEERWQTLFGSESLLALRHGLERLNGEPDTEISPLFRGLEPYPDGWRASLPKPRTLPHFPMILHRGGFPDGS
jgi:hypothetical protein